MFAPVVAVVTTIDREHLDQYSSLEDIQSAFLQFVNSVPFYGAAILCLDEPNVQAIIPNVKRPIITYGTSSQADLVISDIEMVGLGSRVPAYLQRRRSRHVPIAASAGNSQCAQCCCRCGRGAVSKRSFGSDPRRAGEICGRGAPVRHQGSGERYRGRGRLRPSPCRNSRHAGSRARLQVQPPAGAVSAAPVLPHAASCGTSLLVRSIRRTCWC